MLMRPEPQSRRTTDEVDVFLRPESEHQRVSFSISANICRRFYVKVVLYDETPIFGYISTVNSIGYNNVLLQCFSKHDQLHSPSSSSSFAS